MRKHKRIPAILLAASMTLSVLAPAQAVKRAEKIAVPGSVQATVRIDYVQELEELQARGIKAELLKGQTSLGTVSLTDTAAASLGSLPASVSMRDRLGGELNGSALPGALDLTVDNLAQGNYTLRFTGEGYAAYEVDFELGSYSKYVEVGTGDGTFSLGDLDGNGSVGAADRDALSNVLGSTKPADIAKYDLNGDNRIDIIDLAYVNHNIGAKAEAAVLDTACLTAEVDESGTEKEMAADGTKIIDGQLSDLLQDNSHSVHFKNESDPNHIQIPVLLASQVEAESLEIATPDAGGTIQKGTVEVEYTEIDGSGNSGKVSVPFDHTAPEGVHAIGRNTGSSVITISLGKRVAVKKITITVTQTANGDYAAVETIRFLKDIVPEGLVEPNSEVAGLSAEAGDGLVNLTWKELPNVSGYRVEYWEKDKGESDRLQLNVDVVRAEVTGLDNLKTYCFTVTPTDGSWTGRTCVPVEATPQPAKAPKAPDMVNIAPDDAKLKVSWKAAENATWYEVYYTDQADAPTSSYQQAGDRLTATSTELTGLKNGTAYYLYVVAGNEMGRSGPSRIYSGIPKETDYSRPEGIPTAGVLEQDAIERVWLADSGNVSPSSYPDEPFQVENMNDGDFRTHWTSQSYGDGNWARSKQIFASFSEPVDISSVIWVPRLDGSYSGNLRLYTVTVWRQGDDLTGPGTLVAPDPLRGGDASNHNTWLSVGNSPSTTRFAVLPFEPVTDVVKVAITIEQVAYSAVSLSELMFLEYDPAHSLPDNIKDLFADELYTQLKDDVTEEQIDALKARLDSDEKNYYLNPKTLADELALAEELWNGKENGGVVIDGISSRSNAADGAKYSQSGSELQPLGAAAKAGQEITVYASGIPAGQSVNVYATQFNAEASTWQAKVGTLVNGRNILVVPKIGSQNTPRGGSLYLTYSGADPEGIKLHVRRIVDIPMLELADWYTIDESVKTGRIEAYVEELTAYVTDQGINNSNAQTNCLNVTEISMPSALLSLPAAAVLGANGQSSADKAANLYQNVLAWEDLMHICKTTQGIDKTYAENDMTSRQNIRCMQMFTGAFMYAAGNHVGIGYGSCSGVVSGKPITALPEGAEANQIFGWGIAHEIGHNMDKLGRAEITNNIYSIMAQTYDGKQNTLPSRLEKSGKYPAIFTKTAEGWPGASNNVFVQLGMYWQLHLAYDDGDSPMDFYNRFFKAWKVGTYTQDMGNLSYDEKVALTASGTAEKNLTEFFERWGMTLSAEVETKLADYDAEDRAVWYLSDQSRRERLNGAQAAEGTLTASAAIKEGTYNTIQVSIESALTNGKLQGFEILRNNKSIAFVIPDANGAAVYEDVIGSGNHRTYEYQVKAYDILGNQMGEEAAKAGEVRVAYDKTVDASTYKMTRNGTTVTIQFTEGTSISGLKLTGANRPTSGDFTVTVDASFKVKEDDGSLTPVDKTVTARTGSFDQGNQAVDDQNSYLTYFQKPDVTPDDTRIWTYDAKSVTITGIPEAMKDEEIQLVSYAGDDVSFWTEGFVGRLSADYQYGPGEDDVIPKDTLVIVGTYRGDPKFNIVKLMGRFTKTTDEGNELEPVERYLDGYALMFAEIPEDQQVSDISDGLFIFVPNVQKEAELQQEDPSHCDGVNLLPSQMKAVLSRTDLPEDAESQRVSAETLWMNTPGGSDLPIIELEGNAG